MSQVVENDDFEITGSVGANVVPAPAGNHIAVCVGMINVGTIEEENFKTKKKEKKNKVRIIWELVNTSHVFNEEKGAEPFKIAKDYVLSMNPKANLRKMLESWRGTNFNNEEAKTFNIAKVLDKACLVNVIHKTSSNGNIYANISAVTPLPAGTNVPAPKSEILKFAWKKPATKENFMADAFAKLPKYLQEQIESSDEYKSLSGFATTTTAAAAPVATKDNVPF